MGGDCRIELRGAYQRREQHRGGCEQSANAEAPQRFVVLVGRPSLDSEGTNAREHAPSSGPGSLDIAANALGPKRPSLLSYNPGRRSEETRGGLAAVLCPDLREELACACGGRYIVQRKPWALLCERRCGGAIGLPQLRFP